jgi:transcriptional regulator with XRE-family HTH domain
MRLEISSESRKRLFSELRTLHGCTLNTTLAKKLNVSYSTLKRWIRGESLIPSYIIPESISGSLVIAVQKDDNWGARDGGRLCQQLMNDPQKRGQVIEWRRKGGLMRGKRLQEFVRSHKEMHARCLSAGKYRKGYMRMLQKTKENESYFSSPTAVIFDKSRIVFSINDMRRRVTIPERLTPLLAEEIGMHIGDGCLLESKSYFSIRGDIREVSYFRDFVIPLYMKLFNLEIPLIERPPVAGIEVCSKALYSFKAGVIGIPAGRKVDRIEVPKCVLESRDRDVITSFLRGVFDTDGCVYLNRKKRYSYVQINIKSLKLLEQLKELLDRLGFFPTVYAKGYSLKLNGPIQTMKWFREIGSSNLKHKKRFEEVKSYFKDKGLWGSLDSLGPCGGSDPGSNPGRLVNL